MTVFPWLSTITFLPLLGALFLALMVRDHDPERAAENSRQAALVISLIVFAISLKIWFDFDLNTYNFQYQENITWLQDYNINYRMGVDGISVLFVLLIYTFNTYLYIGKLVFYKTPSQALYDSVPNIRDYDDRNVLCS